MGKNNPYNWGYDSAAAMANEMAGGGRVAVKNHTRAPRIAVIPAVPPQAPSMPQGLAGMAPGAMGGGMKKGGKVRGYAKGGKVNKAKEPPKPESPEEDAPQQNAGMKRGGRVKDSDADCYAKGGKVKGMKEGGKWIGKIGMKKGALHREMGVPEGEKIPAKKLAAAAKKGGTEGRRARLAETLKSFHKK